MNKNWLKMKNDKRADMGVGTMIIFIAMVLVAAVAASVLISVSNTVREQAQSTGDQAITNVASGFIVQDVVGQIKADMTSMSNVTIYMRLASGSPNINMDNVMISVTTTADSNYLSLNEAARTTPLADTNFGFEKTLNVQDYEANVFGQGDLAKITIIGLAIGFNELVTIKIVPAYGQMNLITFVSPEQYSSEFLTMS
jgi:flagellin FlaB